MQQGLNVGWIHNIFGVQGLGALLQALSQTADANVLSTPNLITLDNEEAKIVVGTNVPIQTGSYSNLTSATATSAFNTFDRVDVGLTLHVKPQITDGGILKLQLYTEDSAIVTGTTNATTNPAGPEFTKRSIQSTVLADNGEIIVLGGLMQDNYQVSNSKVPLLGDIPWIGQLFRSEQKTRNKTNLMVFLRPVIINDRGTAQAVTSNRYDYIQGVQGAYKQDNNLMKDNDDPVVPPMPIGPSQGGSPAMNLFDLDKMRRQQMAPPPANAGPAAGHERHRADAIRSRGAVHAEQSGHRGAFHRVAWSAAVSTPSTPPSASASPAACEPVPRHKPRRCRPPAQRSMPCARRLRPSPRGSCPTALPVPARFWSRISTPTASKSGSANAPATPRFPKWRATSARCRSYVCPPTSSRRRSTRRMRARTAAPRRWSAKWKAKSICRA